MPSIIGRPYQQGDLASIPCAEKNPFPEWPEYIEQNADGLTSYHAESGLLAVIGFILISPGVADAFAVIDRDAASGQGMELANLVKSRIIALMEEFGLHRVQCTLDPSDQAARVFLRATGYRFESVMRRGAPDKSDLHVYTILER